MRSAYLRMADAKSHTTYPRPLRAKEIDLLESVLPSDRSGYGEYRDLIAKMVVLGQGRRGKGNLVLGFTGDVADTTSPLASVIAYGVVQTTQDSYSVTVREYVGNQIDIEIVSGAGEEIPDHFEEKRRWTYSTWAPGMVSPASGLRVREVPIADHLVLAIAGEEKRLWVHDRKTGMNLLIPITNFYNELMLYKNIRDPKVALASRMFFENLPSFSDSDLRAAFIAYNKLRRKVDLSVYETATTSAGTGSWIRRLFRRQP